MKKMCGAVFVVMMTLVAGAQTSATVKDDLFTGTEIFAKGATDVNEITMDPGTLGMVDGKNQGKAHRMVLSVVRTYTYDKPGMYRIEDVDAFRNKLNTGDWHCSVHTRSLKTGESTDVCNKQRSDDMVETAIITVEPKELTFIHTIRHKSANGDGGYGGSSLMMMPGGMDPSWRAEMAIGMAEMHAQMAEMRAMSPGMMGTLGSLDLSGLKVDLDKSLRGFTDGSVRKSLDDATRSLDELKKEPGKSKKPDTEKLPE